jgi:cytochrome c5
MSRVLAFLLAFTLLFQMSWAVAATYCEHETSSTATVHFGHHAHVHKAADGKQLADGKLAVDDDCSGCHAGHAAIAAVGFTTAATGAPSGVDVPPPSLHGSALARAPDRPQWPRLA